MDCSSRALLSRGLVHSVEDCWGAGSVHPLRKEPGDLERSDPCYRQGGLKIQRGVCLECLGAAPNPVKPNVKV